MSAFIAFILILFAPRVGIEPGFIDDAASRAVLYPPWVPIGAALFGCFVELALLLDLHRQRPRPLLETLRSVAASYLGTAAVAVFVRTFLASPVLGNVIVSRGGHLTLAGWSILGATAAVLLVGGTLVGAVFARWWTAGRGMKEQLSALAAQNGLSLAAGSVSLFLLSRFR